MTSKTVMLACICFLLCLGCFVIGYQVGHLKPWLLSAERRLQEARADIASDIRQHREPGEQYPGSLARRIRYGSILAELSVHSPRSLDSPAICAAIVYSLPEQSLLVVDWIENDPTPDTIRVVLTDGTTRDFPILADDIEENRKVARHSVLFNASVSFLHDSADEKEMMADPGASAVLVQAGVEKSARMPVAWVRGTSSDEEEAGPATELERLQNGPTDPQ